MGSGISVRRCNATEIRAAEARDEEPTDRDLIERAQSGDSRAFGLLIRRYQRRVFGLGLRFFRNEADADDLVQETFLRAWRSIDRFDLSREFAPWILRIASNRALTHLDARKRESKEPLSEETLDPSPQPDARLDRKRLQTEVERAVHELPAEQRWILLLRTVEGLSYREISDSLDIPIGTVMSRLSRARETLRKRVRR